MSIGCHHIVVYHVMCHDPSSATTYFITRTRLDSLNASSISRLCRLMDRLLVVRSIEDMAYLCIHSVCPLYEILLVVPSSIIVINWHVLISVYGR